MDELKSYIREIPDFPQPGILFYDITTLLRDPRGLRETVDRFVWHFIDHRVSRVVGMESRGFMFAPILACALNAGFVPVRKKGKLPGPTIQASYDLEYGQDTLEMHQGAIERGDSVLIIDDLIATGGTAKATAELVEMAGGKVAGFGFVVELSFLNGRAKLEGYDVQSLLRY